MFFGAGVLVCGGMGLILSVLFFSGHRFGKSRVEGCHFVQDYRTLPYNRLLRLLTPDPPFKTDEACERIFGPLFGTAFGEAIVLSNIRIQPEYLGRKAAKKTPHTAAWVTVDALIYQRRTSRSNCMPPIISFLASCFAYRIILPQTLCT
jgi:hypothetical protein